MIGTNIDNKVTTTKLPKMQIYSEQSHPNLYNEIIKDHNFRYGKFSPIPYPQYNNEEGKSNGTK